jgi:hypothetical protein
MMATMSVDEIEKAITKLPANERARLIARLAERDANEWDRQIEADATNGKLDGLAQKALEDVKIGRFKPL